MYSIRYACQNVMQLEFSRQDLEKCSNIKFHENPSSGRRIVLCGRTDRHDETNSSFSQFYESARKRISGVLPPRCL
jgi:hypothetical protein